MPDDRRGYLPSPLTGIEDVNGLKLWLDREMEQMALHARSADITGIKTVAVALGETVEEHTVTIAGLVNDLGTVEASLTEETTFRISADEALALRITTLSSELDGVRATITQNYQTQVDQNGVLALATTMLRSETETNFAQVTETMGTLVTQTTAYAWHTLELDVNGYVSGTYTENDGATATITFAVDKIYIAKPSPSAISPRLFLESGTSQEGGTTVTLMADVIQAGAIVTSGISTGQVTSTSAATGAGGSDQGDEGDEHAVVTKTIVGNESSEGVVLVQFSMSVDASRDPYDARDIFAVAVFVDDVQQTTDFRLYPLNIGADSIIRGNIAFSTVIEGISPGSREFSVKTIATPINADPLDDQARYEGAGSASCDTTSPTIIVTELKR